MKSNEWWRILIHKFKYRRRDQMIQPFCRIGSPQEIKLTLFNLKTFQKSEKSVTESFRRHWNIMNDKEFGSFKFSKLKYRRAGGGGANNSAVLQNWFPPTNYVTSLSVKSEKNAVESCRMHWNLMNDKKYVSFKFLKLKYRSGDQLIQQFCRISSCQEITSPLFHLRKF